MAASPPIDYTNRDYASLRQALLDLARLRLPEWTDRSPADFGVLMVDLFAYAADVVLYYQDRIANESFLHTAVERRSVMHLLRLIGYEMAPPVAAAAELTLTFKAPPQGAARRALIPTGAQFLSAGPDPQTFEYVGPDLTIDLDSDQVEPGPKDTRVYRTLPVQHSRGVRLEVLGGSTGEPNQRFRLSQKPLILDSLVIEVDEGAGWVAWDRRESLLYNRAPDGRITLSSALARDYYVQFDDDDTGWVVFGDGVYGRRPAPGQGNIRASYRVGGGAVGNVPRRAIAAALTKIHLLEAVTNEQPAAGGADHESIEHAVRFGPLAFRSGQRAVTLTDYIALAHQAGGVAKVRAHLRSWNQIELYVAPAGEGAGPVPEDLRRRLLAYFEDKRVAGTFVDIIDPTYVAISIALDVVAARNYRVEQVRQGVQAAVRALYAFDNVDFGQPLYLSDLYARVDTVPGVQAITVRRFRRVEAGGKIVDVPVDGRIDLEPFEIPYLEEEHAELRLKLTFLAPEAGR